MSLTTMRRSLSSTAPALLELAEGPGDRNPLAADHRAQLLVGVVGADAVALAVYNPL
jgi:hypothetical protein